MVSRLLEKDPDHRITIDEALFHPWIVVKLLQPLTPLGKHQEEIHNTGALQKDGKHKQRKPSANRSKTPA